MAYTSLEAGLPSYRLVGFATASRYAALLEDGAAAPACQELSSSFPHGILRTDGHFVHLLPPRNIDI